MTTLEILQHIANVHNNAAGITVSGDNAIMMGEALKELRYLAVELQKIIEAESAEEDPVKEQQEEQEE